MLTTTRPELVGDFGMVASTHWLASAVGMRVLERGGNAADAAVAAGFALQVVEPHLNGPGGDVPILVSDNGTVFSICGQGGAPQRATIARFEELGIDLIPGTGLLPAVVPGAFGGWITLAQRWGTWPLRELLEPAIQLAASGHPLVKPAADKIRGVEALFRDEWQTSAAVWLPGGAAPAAGHRLRNPTLAQTYRRVIDEAESRSRDRNEQLSAACDVWYRGFVAELIDAFCRQNEILDSSGRRHYGLLTADDLAEWRPTVELPCEYQYGRFTVFKTRPWGQGPVFIQQLAILAHTDIAEMTPHSADWLHTIIEAAKLAFADREAWYGDPDVVDVPLTDLFDPEYNAARARLIGPNASMAYRPGAPGGRRPVMPRPPARNGAEVIGPGIGEPTIASGAEARGDTCHLDVVDRNGLMISATPSGGWLHSSPLIPELGFCLGTRGQMFWLQPGLPNSLRPGARPRTTLTPSIAYRDGRPWLAFGTPGGDQQDQWSLHFFLNVAQHGMNLQQAIEAPHFQSNHMISSFYPRSAKVGEVVLEGRISKDTVRELERRGHAVTVEGPWSLGRMSAVADDGEWLKAAANPRGAQGYAAGR